jgi:hypothetical protein
MDGAGRLIGDLTPECSAAVTAVVEALGKKRGPEDDRTPAQRFHDALQEGCELLIRAKMVPDRAGSDTRVDVAIPLSALRGMDGASLIEEAWLRARAGQRGYLAGQDAEAIACDALIVPVVTGSPDWAVIAQMITLVTGCRAQARADGGGPGNPAGQPARPGQPGDPGEPDWPHSLPAEEQQALLYAMARLAIDFASGPGGIASALRRTLLGAQLNGKSIPLDVGYKDHIPAAIPRAVIQRDKHCAWPAGCDRPAAVSDVHHITQKGRPHQRQRLPAAVQLPPRHLHPPAGMENRTPARRISPRHRTPRPDHPKPPAAHHPRQVTAPQTPAPPRPRPETTTPIAGEIVGLLRAEDLLNGSRPGGSRPGGSRRRLRRRFVPAAGRRGRCGGRTPRSCGRRSSGG